MKYGFGVDLGGTTVKIAYFDENGTMLDKWEIPTVTENGGEGILPDSAASVKGYIEKNALNKTSLLGIGIGVPGPVIGNGVVKVCDNLGWGTVDVRAILSGLTGLPVSVGNDANLAALGEGWKGGGKDCPNMVLVTLGTGVGGGIVVDGKQVCGVFGAGGEIGHMVLVPDETEYCNCGKRGCAEQYCSATGIVRVAKRYLEAHGEESCLRKLEKLTAKDVFDASNAGDAAAQAILEQVYDYMGQFLANISCVVDPEVFVFGGGVSRAGQPLLEGARRAFDKYVYHASTEVRFALALLGNDAGAYGAFRLVKDEYGN